MLAPPMKSRHVKLVMLCKPITCYHVLCNDIISNVYVRATGDFFSGHSIKLFQFEALPRKCCKGTVTFMVVSYQNLSNYIFNLDTFSIWYVSSILWIWNKICKKQTTRNVGHHSVNINIYWIDIPLWIFFYWVSPDPFFLGSGAARLDKRMFITLLTQLKAAVLVKVLHKLFVEA